MSLQKLTTELYQLFEAKNYDKAQKLLVPIKIELIKHNLLVPLPSNTGTTDQLNDLKIAERILEIGALSSLLGNNYQGFENYYAQLRPFYTNDKLHQTEVDSDSTKITSLFLLYLLSQGLISKFHIELESIYNSNRFKVDQDKYLQFPVTLERNLMEGNYIKIWKLLKQEQAIPASEFTHFIPTLISALRYEIAKSLEVTYDLIPISNCKSLLYYPQELSDQAFETTLREELDANWTFRDGYVVFDTNRKDNEFSDSNNIITNVLNYAEQIESIV